MPEVPTPDAETLASDSQAVVSDSIYAKEITIDVGGVTVIDRQGRRLRIDVDASVRTPRAPRSRRDIDRYEDVVHIFADIVTIEKGEVIDGDVVCVFGGRVQVLGEVKGSVVSVFGTINVEGSVGDAAVAPFGTVRIGPNGTVAGDVVASDIEKEPGGRIGGVRNELFFNLLGGAWKPRGERWAQTSLTVLVVLKVLFLVFLVLVAHALAAQNVAKVKHKIQMSFFKSFFTGVAVQILLLPALLLLIVTIIGIPVAFFLVPLMIMAAVVLSQAAVGLFVGEKLHQNTELTLRTPLAQTLAGLLALQSVSVLAVVFAWAATVNSAGGSFRLIAFSLLVLSILLGYVVVTLGTGAVVMTRFGTRPKDAAVEPPPRPTKPTPLPSARSDDSGTAPTVG